MLQKFNKMILAFLILAGGLTWGSSATADAAYTILPLDKGLEVAVQEALAMDTSLGVQEDEMRILTELYAYKHKNIQSLQGLEKAVYLEELVLDGNSLDSIEPIALLQRLNFLALTGTGTKSLEPLRNLKEIRKLLLSDNQIEDISPLIGMSKLTDLLIQNNEVENLSPLGGKPLTWLTASKNRIKDLSVLAEIPTLQTVYLDHNQITDISVLLKLQNLKTVAINDNPLNDEAASIVQQLLAKGVKLVDTSEQKPGVITVLVNDDPILFSQAPTLLEGNTVVQFRPLFEKFGLEVGWDQETRTVTGKKDRLLIELVIDSQTARVNGREFELPVPPALMDGNTMIPLRFIGEATGRKVMWDGPSSTVRIQNSFTSSNVDMIFSNDTAYEGNQVNGKPDGRGKLVHKGTLLYEGDFKEGFVEGQGKMYDVNNPASYYEGSFQNNRFQGQGKLVYDDGDYYVGPFVNGMREGSAKMYLKDGTLAFDGLFKDDARNGLGTGYYGADYKYVGLYANNRFHGQGKMYYKGNLDFEGEWNQEQKVRGKKYVNGELVYDGSYRNDKPHGYGTFINKSGETTYRGQVRNWKSTGLGIIYYENRDRFVGEVYNGKADGKGILYDQDGKTKHDGHFKDGAIDLNPEATAKETSTLKKLLKRRADHSVVDGMNKNSMGLKPTQAAMFIQLESEEHLNIFNGLSTNAKIELVNEYAQENWGDVLGVSECFTFIMYGKNTFARATLTSQMKLEDIKISLFPEGKAILK
ncbi:MAG: hypothetical protein K0Q73_6556 [Paenibacillus sp.]|jgi:hypothetical protein|nr:hypothetical protein [Paenibacillus sp.]